MEGGLGGAVCFCGGDGSALSEVGGLLILSGGVGTGFWASREAVSSSIVLNSPEATVGNVSNGVSGIADFDTMGKFDVNISPSTGLSTNSTSESRRFIASGVAFS